MMMKTKIFTLLLMIVFPFVENFAEVYSGVNYLRITDFEDGADCFTRISTADVESKTVITNPYQTGINTSSKVLEVKLKQAHTTNAILAQDYRDGGWLYPIGNATETVECKYRYAHFKVWKPVISPMMWSFRNATGGNDGLSLAKLNTTVNGWEYIVIDLLEGKDSYHVQPNTNHVGFNLNLDYIARTDGITVYLDDIYLSNSLDPITEIPNVINVALGKTANDFGDYLTNFPGNKVVDGVISDASRWVSIENNYNEHKLEVDLGGSFLLNSVAVYRDLVSNGSQKMKNFTFQFSNSTNENDIWETVFSVENNETNALYIKNFDEIIANKVRFYVPAYSNNRVRLFELEVYGRPVTTWKGTSGSNWNIVTNWDNGIPNSNYFDVIIPAGGSPVVPDAGVTINNITIQAGAEIGNQHLLTYNKAFVQYDFNSANSRNRWHMLSLPLQQAYVGDFTFGGYPRTAVRKFEPSTEGSTQYAGWNEDLRNDEPLKAGDSFIIWLTNESFMDKGLCKSGGILQLPYFESDATLNEGVHYTHEYTPAPGADGVIGTSRFYNFQKAAANEYERSSTFYDVTRKNTAYKLAESPVSEALTFGHDNGYESDFALVGNPFMATIDFDALYNNNSDKIKQNYQIWTGKGEAAGFTGYSKDGYWGIADDLDEDVHSPSIAPMQAFFVEKAEGYVEVEEDNLEFNIAMTTGVTESGVLKSAESANNKLEIKASNNVASVLTFIADREGGQDVVGNRDARKLISGISNTPEVYTLKDQVALGANIIRNDHILIPIGLATAYSGNMKLTFRGMDTYDAQITLIDTESENGNVDLTGLDTPYEYEFTCLPPTVEDKIVANESRFFIQIQPIQTVPTGISRVAGLATVYVKNNTIYAVSGSSDSIKQIFIYNTQGALLYADKNVNAQSHTIPRNTNIPPVSIVKLVTEKGVKNVKVIEK
jgi:hypothetical protein